MTSPSRTGLCSMLASAVVLLALVGSTPSDAERERDFYIIGDMGVCANMTVEFEIRLFLLDGIRTAQVRNFSEIYHEVVVEGTCGDWMALGFDSNERVRWEWDIVPANSSSGQPAYAYQRTVQFVPSEVFGPEIVPDTSVHTFKTLEPDNPILPKKDYSYACFEEKTTYYPQINSKGAEVGVDFSYGVAVTVQNIQVQVGHMTKGEFGPVVTC